MAGYEYFELLASHCRALLVCGILHPLMHSLHVHIIMLIVALVSYSGYLVNGLGTRLKLPCLTSLFSRLVCGHENLGAH